MKTKATKDTIKVKLYIRPEPVTERQRRLWRAWWARLIDDCQRELNAEGEAQGER